MTLRAALRRLTGRARAATALLDYGRLARLAEHRPHMLAPLITPLGESRTYRGVFVPLLAGVSRRKPAISCSRAHSRAQCFESERPADGSSSRQGPSPASSPCAGLSCAPRLPSVNGNFSRRRRKRERVRVPVRGPRRLCGLSMPPQASVSESVCGAHPRPLRAPYGLVGSP